MKKLKKKPSDYGQFYFRVDKEVQSEVEAEIQAVLELAKLGHKEDELLPKRNDLILEALKIGLKKLSKKYG